MMFVKYLAGLILTVLLVIALYHYEKPDAVGTAMVQGLVNPPSDCGCGWEPADGHTQWK